MKSAFPGNLFPSQSEPQTQIPQALDSQASLRNFTLPPNQERQKRALVMAHRVETSATEAWRPECHPVSHSRERTNSRKLSSDPDMCARVTSTLMQT